jgi:hypothetical protein
MEATSRGYFETDGASLESETAHGLSPGAQRRLTAFVLFGKLRRCFAPLSLKGFEFCYMSRVVGPWGSGRK